MVDELVDALRKVNAEGTNLLVVEQGVATALEFVDHAYVIDQGRTVVGGTSVAIARDRRFVPPISDLTRDPEKIQ